MKVKNEERIARLEAICDKMRAEEPDVQENALQAAILVKDEELAAALARMIRDKLLVESDGKLAFDRWGINVPEEVSMTTILPAFKALADGFKRLLCSDWAAYRQALRDLPQQEGFPFVINWPEAPDAKKDDEQTV